MQFKHPELLWALFLLLIPILVHLFQLRRFKRTPFTNVRLLQKVVARSRKSRSLKKWLLLATRLLLLGFLILAFSQPFLAGDTALKEKQTVFYLDNSFSMQAKKENTTLLRHVIQQLLTELPAESSINLFTNTEVFQNVPPSEIQNQLLDLSFTPEQLRLNDIYLKAGTLFENRPESIRNLIVVSDFQQRILSKEKDSGQNFQKHLLRLDPDRTENVSIDSVFVGKDVGNTLELVSMLSSSSEIGDIPVSLYNAEKLIAKASADFDGKGKATISFTVPKDRHIRGKLEITDTGLTYDNQLYFNLSKKEPIKVSVVGNAGTEYLERIFTEDEFELTLLSPTGLDLRKLENQHLLILNELPDIPVSLRNAIKNFRDNGGHVLLIPSENSNLASYNTFLNGISGSSLQGKTEGERVVSGIQYSHPLYQGVFKEEIGNFQYPKVSSHYKVSTKAPQLLSFEDGTPFLIGREGFYFFTASISAPNTNLKDSPLIVPTLYNMGLQSLRTGPLYGMVGKVSQLDIPVALGRDNILKVSGTEGEFIPQQSSYSTKTTLNFGPLPEKDGWYDIIKGTDTLKNISFNYPRDESVLMYTKMGDMEGEATISSETEALFDNIEKGDGITPLWKWFIILALLFIVVEILIQKIFQ
ncbi:MAG: BatA domain-containing protein [Sediminicola sp.]